MNNVINYVNSYKGVLCFICSLVIISLVVWKYYKLELVRVEGHSMNPTLLHGRPVLIRKRLKYPKDLVYGKIFVYKCDRGFPVIKRLTESKYINGEFYGWFEGDNASDSRDSREYGYVNVANIEGVLVFNKEQKIT